MMKQILITVNGGYFPDTIQLKQDQPTTLNFVRRSDRGCLDVVQSQDLDFKADLPLNQTVAIEIPTHQAGTYTFSCGMDMFHGKVVITK